MEALDRLLQESEPDLKAYGVRLGRKKMEMQEKKKKNYSIVIFLVDTDWMSCSFAQVLTLFTWRHHQILRVKGLVL